MNISFVILHYMAIDDTIECINSIIDKLVDNRYSIVIVDNASPNNSGTELLNKYKENKNIKVIISEKNLGFANGNNLGYEYAKNKFKSDFILMINNDTIINQSDFINKIVECFAKTNFYVLGPDIISIKDNIHQNPQRIIGLTKLGALKYSLQLNLLIALNHFNFDDKFTIFINKIKRKNNLNTEQWKIHREDVQLHGACLIFSPNYIRENEVALDKNTFMYLEEDILYYKMKKEHKKIVYNPSICILHKEDAATDIVYKNSKEKRKFFYVNSLNSCKYLLKLMIKEGK